MTKRMISARAFDPEHKKLMLAYQRARGGDRLRALAALKNYVTGRLSDAAKARKAA